MHTKIRNFIYYKDMFFYVYVFFYKIILYLKITNKYYFLMLLIIHIKYYIHEHLHTYIHTYIHTHIHIYIHTHTYIHTHIPYLTIILPLNDYELNLTQHVNFPTHSHGHTLDIIITLSSSNWITRSTLLTDHYAIDCHINITKLRQTRRLTTYRSFNKIDYDSFSLDLMHSMRANDITVQTLYTSLKYLIYKHAQSTKTKYFSIHINSPWFNSTLSKLKQNFRKYNRNYTSNPSSYNLSQLVTASTIYRKALKYNKINYIKNTIETNSKDYKNYIILRINY